MNYDEYKSTVMALHVKDPRRKHLEQQYPTHAARYAAQCIAAWSKAKRIVEERKNKTTQSVFSS